jgi:Protein of unknown function (DUF664)
VLKSELHTALKQTRVANLSMLDGVGEFDLRRPLTPTGTNLLGVIKHLGGMEYGYLCETFGWTLARHIPGDEDPDNLGDSWATKAETVADIVGWYREACDHADATIDALEFDEVGSVPHWQEGRRQVTLASMMVLVLGEEQRHGGHLDVVRELIDGTTHSVVSSHSQQWWAGHVGRLQALAEWFR